MSLDNTSQPSVKYCADKLNAKYIHGRPEPELVPSRYALKVGEIDVMVVSDGVLSLPASKCPSFPRRGASTVFGLRYADAHPRWARTTRSFYEKRLRDLLRQLGRSDTCLPGLLCLALASPIRPARLPSKREFSNAADGKSHMEFKFSEIDPKIRY